MELQRKNIGRLNNVLTLYETYSDENIKESSSSSDVLDVWIIERLHELIRDVTQGYKAYELDKATRPVTDFIDDLSVWYVRRSRDRFKSEDETEKQNALGTIQYVLKTLSLVIAASIAIVF